MKRSIFLVLGIFVILFAILLAGAQPGDANWRGGVWIGPGGPGPGFGPGPGPGRGGVWFGPGWGPWWWGSLAFPYYDYPSQPVIIQQQTPAYDQQPEEQYYWYYCQESKTYYPYVKECPKGWIKVAPTPVQPKGGK